jgi:hypothetical protein
MTLNNRPASTTLASWPSRKLHGNGACQILPPRWGPSRESLHNRAASTTLADWAFQQDIQQRGLPDSSWSPWPARKSMDNGAARKYNVNEGEREVSVYVYNHYSQCL